MKKEITIYELKPIFKNNVIGQTVATAEKDVWTEEDLKSEISNIKEYAVFKCTRIR